LGTGITIKGKMFLRKNNSKRSNSQIQSSCFFFAVIYLIITRATA
jgi:hypothetical protein